MHSELDKYVHEIYGVNKTNIKSQTNTNYRNTKQNNESENFKPLLDYAISRYNNEAQSGTNLDDYLRDRLHYLGF